MPEPVGATADADGEPEDGAAPPDAEVEDEVEADVAEQDFASTVGRRLRAIRQAQGLSLVDVEERSGGRWSSSAIGAYERGFRNLSLPRLKALAQFYRVPVGVLLGEAGPFNQPPERKKLVLSLEALAFIDEDEPVRRFIQSIITARGDFNGRVLSLRHDDLKALCTLVGGDIPTGIAELRSWGVLIEGPELEGVSPAPE